MLMTRSTPQSSQVSPSLFFFQAEDGIRDVAVTGVQTCALPISRPIIGLARHPGAHLPRAHLARDEWRPNARHRRPPSGNLCLRVMPFQKYKLLDRKSVV